MKLFKRFTIAIFILTSSAWASDLPADLEKVKAQFFADAYKSFLPEMRTLLKPGQALGQGDYAPPPYDANLSRNQWLDSFVQWTHDQALKESPQAPVPDVQILQALAANRMMGYYQNAPYAKFAFLQDTSNPVVSATDAEIKNIQEMALPASYPDHHTLNVLDYVNERFPQALLDLIQQKKLPLFLDDGTCQVAAEAQRKMGYDQVVKFMGRSDNSDTQFFFAIKKSHPDDKRFVACDMIGADDVTRILAILGPWFVPSGKAHFVRHQLPEEILTLNSFVKTIKFNPEKDRVFIGFQNTVWWAICGGNENGPWKRTSLSSAGAELDLFSNPQTGQQVVSLANVYGDEMRLALNILYGLGLRRFVYMGTAGGVDKTLHLGDVLLPSQFLEENNSWVHLENSARNVQFKLPTSISLLPDAKQGWVPTLIAETFPKIYSLAGSGVQGLDIESKYFAEFFSSHPASETTAIITVSDTPLGTDTFDKAVQTNNIPMISINALVPQLLALP